MKSVLDSQLVRTSFQALSSCAHAQCRYYIYLLDAARVGFCHRSEWTLVWNSKQVSGLVTEVVEDT